MKLSLLLIALTLTGCATTPSQTMETEPYRFSSTKPPGEVAKCLVRTAENVSGNFSGRTDEPPLPGGAKVVIRHPEAGTSAVAHITPTPTGSDVVFWLSWQHFMARDTLFAAMTRGC